MVIGANPTKFITFMGGFELPVILLSVVDFYAAEYCVAKGFIDDSPVKVMTIAGGYFKFQRQLKIIMSDKRPTLSDDFLRHDRGHLPAIDSNRRK